MILTRIWEAIFAQTSTGYCIFSRAFWAPILLACEAFVPQLSIYVHTFQIYAKIGASQTNFKVKFFHWNFNQIFGTLKNGTFWHTLTSKLVKMVMPQYIEGGFMLFSRIHDPHLHISDRILWLRSPLTWSTVEHITSLADTHLLPLVEVLDWHSIKYFQ